VVQADQDVLRTIGHGGAQGGPHRQSGAARRQREEAAGARRFRAMRDRLMDPPLFRVFAAEFAATWNRLQAEASAGLAVRRAELDPVQVQFERLVNGLAEGMPAAAVRTRMAALEARWLQLEAQLASTVVPAPRLHPNLAEVYGRRMAQLTEGLAEEDGAEAREMVRGLVEEIRLVPKAGGRRTAD
jgi:hypothetical protein